MRKEAEERKFERMGKVQDFLEMCQGSQNLHGTQKKSCVQNKQMTAVGYISDTEDILKACWSLLKHDGVAAFTLSERSPLPPPLSAKNHPGGQPTILNDHWIRGINGHPVECDEDSATDSIPDTDNRLNWNWDLDNRNDSEDNCVADVESDLQQDNSIENTECLEQQDGSGTPNVLGLIRPTWKSKIQAEKVLVTINPIETRRNKAVKPK